MIKKQKFLLVPLEERIVLDSALVATVLHVTTGNDSGAGSLRDAINTANHASGLDEIEFTLSKSFNGTVNLTSGALTISHNVIINGQGQVTVNGSAASDVFDVNTSHVTLEGLTIVGKTQSSNSGAGIALNGSNNLVANNTILGNYQGVLDNAGNNTISNDFIGTNAAGLTTGGNAFGVYLDGTGHDTINSDVISGNMAVTATYNFTHYSDFSGGYPSLMGGGIWIAASGAGNNLIENNLLGTNSAATATIANDVAIYSAAGNNTLTGNTVAGYQVLGVFFDSGANNNLIQNNLFDLAFNSKGQAHSLQAAPELDFVSQISSLMLASSNNKVLNNNFAGISYNDIQLFSGANGNVIENNLFGVTPAGQAAFDWGGPDSNDIYAGQVSNTIVSNNTLLNATGNTILFYGFDTFNSSGSASQNLQITNNTMGAPALYENSDYMFALGPGVQNYNQISITNNRFSQYNLEGVGGQYDQNFTISNNTFSQVDDFGGYVSSDFDNVIGFSYCQNVTVQNNNISNTISATGTGISDNYNQNVNISNNIIASASLASPGFAGIYNYSDTNFIVSNNSVSNESLYGIFTCEGLNGLIVNNVVNNITAGPNTPVSGDVSADGIRCCVSNSYITIQNNLVTNSDVGIAIAFENTNIKISNDVLINDTVGLYVPDINNQIAVTNTSFIGGQYGLFVDNKAGQYGGPATGNNISIMNSLFTGQSVASVAADSSDNTVSLTNDAFIGNKLAIDDLSNDGHHFLISDDIFLFNGENYNY